MAGFLGNFAISTAGKIRVINQRVDAGSSTWVAFSGDNGGMKESTLGSDGGGGIVYEATQAATGSIFCHLTNDCGYGRHHPMASYGILRLIHVLLSVPSVL